MIQSTRSPSQTIQEKEDSSLVLTPAETARLFRISRTNY